MIIDEHFLRDSEQRLGSYSMMVSSAEHHRLVCRHLVLPVIPLVRVLAFYRLDERKRQTDAMTSDGRRSSDRQHGYE